MEKDDGITGTEVVLHSPTDGMGALVAEIDGDGDAALGAGGRGGGDGDTGRGGLDTERREGMEREVRLG